MSDKVILHIRDYNGSPNQDGQAICTLYLYLWGKFSKKPPYVFTEIEFLKLCEDKEFVEVTSHINFHDEKNYACGNKIEMRPEFKFVLILKRIIK